MKKFIKQFLFQGSTEGIAFIEAIMEHIAKVLQKDPIEVRIKNLKTNDSTILNMMEDFKVTAQYEERKQNVEEFNRVSDVMYFTSVLFSELKCLGSLYWRYRDKILFKSTVIYYRPPLWSSGQSSWLQIRRLGFDSRHYQKKSSGSGMGSTQPREYN
jgi:hypothetical protein